MNPSTTLIKCGVCQKEIPLDAALTAEGSEYVVYLCGLECYERFESHAAAIAKPLLDPKAGGAEEKE